MFEVTEVTTQFNTLGYLHYLLDFPPHWRLQYLHPPEQKQWKQHFHIETHLVPHEVFVKPRGMKQQFNYEELNNQKGKKRNMSFLKQYRILTNTHSDQEACGVTKI